jgi:tRNA A-37 threonylcarbamoyl transferase component Bud32
VADSEDDPLDSGENVPERPIVDLPAWWGPVANESEQLQLSAAEYDLDEFCERIGFDEEELRTFAKEATPRHRYLVCESLSSTPWSWVYLALDTTADRPVVLKISTRGVESEGRTLTQVSHPNVVTVHDMFVAAGYPTLVLEWCTQGNLQRFARGCKDWRDVLARGLEAGRALMYCHEQGLIHGDLKPANILVSRGVGKLADFGLARRETLYGLPFGTRGFFPPERLDGAWTRASDVYSFAMTLEWVLKKCEGVPKAVRSRLAVASTEDPERRPTLPTLIADLEQLLDDDATERLNLESVRREPIKRESGRRRPWAWAQAALVVVCAAIVTSTVIEGMCSPPVERPKTNTEWVVEVTLELAAEAAENGHGPSTVTYLELALSRATRDFDLAAERSVAEAAIQLGRRLAEQGDIVNARQCWSIAHYVFHNDRRGMQRVSDIHREMTGSAATRSPRRSN